MFRLLFAVLMTSTVATAYRNGDLGEFEHYCATYYPRGVESCVYGRANSCTFAALKKFDDCVTGVARAERLQRLRERSYQKAAYHRPAIVV